MDHFLNLVSSSTRNLQNNVEAAVFGGGCFWCTEAVFGMLRGVCAVTPGYAGGTLTHPTYDAVARGTTGHVEVVKVDFNPAEISYHDLLTVFFASHDPTSRDQQGADVGSQYRSVIFYTTPTQADVAQRYIAELSLATPKKIVTDVVPLDTFWSAETYHQQYYEHHHDAPYCELVIAPKLEKVQQRFAALLKTNGHTTT